MGKLLIIILDVLALFSIGFAGVHAAPEAAMTAKVGPYEGTFEGVAYGDKGTHAPLALDLTHRGSKVQGLVSIGEGLYVNGGICGEVNVPPLEQQVTGKTQLGNPRRMVVTPTFDAGGFDIRVKFESTVSSDGDEITAKAKIDLPWFCGRDPVLTATMDRE